MEQEAPDELVGGERHCAVPRLPVAAVILVAEGHAALVESNEATVRDGDAMGSGRDRQALRLARRRPAFADALAIGCRPLSSQLHQAPINPLIALIPDGYDRQVWDNSARSRGTARVTA